MTMRFEPQAHPDQHTDAPDEVVFTPLTAEQVQALGLQAQEVSIAQVLCWQGLSAVVVTALAAWWGKDAALSALYGAMAAWLPTALMAWRLGLLKPNRTHVHAAQWFARFFVWEGVKLLLALVLLFLAPWILPKTNWLALIAGLAVGLKVVWWASAIGRRNS